jgi:cold shock CspA family protein
MRHATVKTYDPRGGFGFVTDESGFDIFLGANPLSIAGIPGLVPGDKVLIDAVLDRRGRGWRVSRIALADHSAVEA